MRTGGEEMLPDNYDMWARHDAEQEAELQKLPKCDKCGKPIQDDYCYDIEGECICEKCLNKHYRKSVEI